MSVATMVNVNTTGNIAIQNGAAMYVEASKISMANRVAQKVEGSSSHAEVRQSTIEGAAGFLYAKTATIDMQHVTIMDSVSKIEGTIGCYGTVINAVGLKMQSNEANSGGAFYGILCNLYIDMSEILNNVAHANGGAIILSMQSEMFVTNTTFKDNVVYNQGNGGAIYLNSMKQAVINFCSFERNTAGRGGCNCSCIFTLEGISKFVYPKPSS